MPSLIASNVAQVSLFYQLGGENMQNVYYVKSDVPWTQSALTDMLTTFTNWETTTASLLRSEQVSCVRGKAVDLTSLSSPMVDSIFVSPLVGQVAFPAMPGNVTYSIKADIGERGRGRAGRKFWIGLAEPMCAENGCIDSFSDDIADALSTLITDLVTANPDWTLGILHTVVSGAPITPALFSPIINWVVTDLILDSLRTRLPGHKRRRHAVAP